MTTIVLTLAILFIATIVKASLGFGDALIAMPLLAFTLGIKTATPLVALVAVSTTGLILWRAWHNIDLQVSWRLILAAAIGIPVGLLVVKTAPEQLVTRALGAVLISFGLYSLFRPKLVQLQQPGWAYIFGFFAGIMASAYNTSGPPLVVYGALRGWSAAQFRATLPSIFLPTSLLTLLSHGVGGLWTARVLWLYVLALPVILLAFVLGSRISRLLPAGRFDRVVHVMLVVLGALLIA